MGRFSEYPPDDLVGMRIETSAMAEQDTLRPPCMDFVERRFRLPPLQEQWQPHAEEYLTMRMIHAR